MTSPNKARKCKICADVFVTLLHHNVTFQSKLISFLNFLRNYSRRQDLQNKGNRMSKKLRSRQVETKSLMGKGVFSSLVVTSKSEYLWINKVWINFPSRRNAQIIIVINKYVESRESWKLFEGKRKLRGSKMIMLTWKINIICEETVAVVPFDLSPWKFTTGWRYNANSMYLSILQFFSLHNFLNRVKEH